MSTEAVVRELFAAFAARDVERILALTDPGVLLWAQPTAEAVGRPKPYRGHDGIRAYMADVATAWTSFAVDPGDLRVAGEGAIAFGHARGERSDGEQVDAPLIWVIRMRGGKIAFVRAVRTVEQAERVAADQRGDVAL